MITPAGSIKDAIDQFNLYQQMKQAIGQSEDFQKIGDKHHPKKSFVRKVQRFFNLSCEITQDEPLKDSEGNIIAWLAKAKAIHLATGAYQEADGSCGFDEKVDKYGNPNKRQQTIHNIRAHAVTRAKNRAILDLVGFGEVSAEEINESEYDRQLQQSYQQQQYQQQYQAEPAHGNHSKKRQLNGMATEQQRKAIFASAKSKGLTDDEIKSIVKFYTGKESSKELTKQEASELIETFKTESLETLRQTVQVSVESTKTKVYDVDPQTGEIVPPNYDGPIMNDEVDDALGGANNG